MNLKTRKEKILKKRKRKINKIEKKKTFNIIYRELEREKETKG